MPSEHSRSSSASSVTSPIPTINIKYAPPQKSNSGNHSSSNSRVLSGELLDIQEERRRDNKSPSREKNRDRSSSRGKSPSRTKNDKKGKNTSGRSKSPSGGDRQRNNNSGTNSRSRSPTPRSKSPSPKQDSRSRSPLDRNHNRNNSDMSKPSSQDARLSPSSHPWIASSSNDRNSSRISNRLSLPPNFNELDFSNMVRENNERWARLKLGSDTRDSKGGIMGSFTKSGSIGGSPILRPNLSVDTFSGINGAEKMKRTPSGQGRTGSFNSPLLVPGGFPLIRARSHNSAMDDVPRLPMEVLKEKLHPLQHAWTMYYDSKPAMTPGPKTPTEKFYEQNLQTIGTFNTVQTFCRYFNWVKKPSHLDVNTNFHIFKDKIKPMWEDPANANGGKWVISMRNPQLLDRCWTWLVFALVGEELDEGDDICGAVMSRRLRGDRIAVWVRDKDNVPVINGIGKRLLKILDLLDEKAIGMDFQFNEDALKSGTSYNNKTYLSLESLKQELESEKSKSNSESMKNPEIKETGAKEPEITVTTPDMITVDWNVEDHRRKDADEGDDKEHSNNEDVDNKESEKENEEADEEEEENNEENDNLEGPEGENVEALAESEKGHDNQSISATE